MEARYELLKSGLQLETKGPQASKKTRGQILASVLILAFLFSILYLKPDQVSVESSNALSGGIPQCVSGFPPAASSPAPINL